MRALILVALLSFPALVAHAQPIVSGDVLLISPPPSVVNVFTGSGTSADIWLFQEQSGIVLAADFDVELSAPGTVTGPNHQGAIPGTILAGTVADVWFFHHRPSPSATNSGSVTFESIVLGVMLGDTALDDSDVLGAPGTLYPTFAVARGTTEPGSISADSVTLSADRRTLDISTRAGGARTRSASSWPCPSLRSHCSSCRASR